MIYFREDRVCFPISVVGSDFVLGLVKLTPMANYLQAGLLQGRILCSFQD
jgi:hypothetical protein